MNPSDEMYTNNYLMKEDPFNIIGNIYYIGNTWAASYLIDTGDGLMLLDTPCWPEFWMWIDSIRQLGFDPMDIKTLVISHNHPDHIGCVQPLLAMNPKIKTYMGEIDGQASITSVQNIKFTKSTYQNQAFVPDVLLKDGDYVELGNTKIKCVLTPGHTKGGMSWFWTVKDKGKKYNVGYYGAAGFSTMALNRLLSSGMTMEEALAYQQVFLDSINKVWDEQVDVNLGNHPFHNDTFEKAERNKILKDKDNAFIDPTEWHRYLTELRDCYTEFLKMTPEEVTEMYRVSYLLVFRDKSLAQHVWPWVVDTK
jgi:metallo-beta-lactamase class B